MAVHKHELTTGKDHIKGGNGSDLFEAPLDIDGNSNATPTLTSQDVLDGGAGKDKLVASLFGGKIAAVMNNIETGDFATDEATKVGLDLAHAAAMKNLVFRQTYADIAQTRMKVTHAAHVTSIDLENADNNIYTLDGVDPSRTMTIKADHSDSSGVTLIGKTKAHYSHLDISVADGSFLGLTGDIALAKTVKIDSTGSAGNAVSFNSSGSGIQHLIVSGSTSINLNSQADCYDDLKTFDASGLHAAFKTNIGGHDLSSVRGGSGNDVLAIKSIGGSHASRAEVDMGGGNDHLVLEYGFNAKTQHYDGGGGHNTLTLTGHVSHLADGIENFQSLEIYDAKGAYNLAMTAQSIVVHVAQAISFNHLASDTEMTVDLDSTATIGDATSGFSAAGLHYASFNSTDVAHDLYVDRLGSSSGAADLGLGGDTHLTLHATNGAQNYIESIVVTDDAGVDISGLSNAFVGTGTTIIGGGGDDILVGGNGADRIDTGAGNNTVIGSFGADVVNLVNGSGADVLEFFSSSQSSYGTGHDTINGFGSFDQIDLSHLGANVHYLGDVATLDDGVAKLSATEAVAFFDTEDHTLYVDVNHDKQLTSSADMAIQLNGVDTFTAGSLIG